MIDNQSAEQPDPVQEKASSEGGMAGLLRLKLKDDGPGDMVSMLGRLGVSPERLKAPRTDLTGDEQNQLFIEGVDRAFDSGEYNQYTLAGPMAEATMKQVGIPDAISEFTGGVIGEINALLNFRGQLLNTATNWTTGKDYDEVLPGWLYKSIGLPSNPGMSGADAIEAQLPEGMSAQERMASIGGESVARDLGGAGTQVMTAIGLSLIPGGQAAAAANTARAAGVVGRLLGPVKQFVRSPGGKLYMGYMGGRQMAESSKEYREYVENQNKYADMYNEALDYLELPFDKIDKDEYSLATDVMTSVGSGAMTAASELIGTGFSVMAGRRIGSRLLPSVFKGNVADRVAYRGMGGLIAQMAKGGVTASAMEGFEEVVDGFGQAVIRGWYSEFERGRFMRTGNPGDLWKTIQQHAPDLAYQFAIAATVTLPLGIGGSLAVARRDNRTLEAFAEARLRDRLAEGEGVESGVADHVASKVIYDHAMGQGDKDQVAIRAAVQQLRGRMEEVGNVTEDMLMDPEFAARFVEAFPELAFKIGQSESLSRTQLQWLTGQNTTSSGARQAFLDRVRRGSSDQVGAYVAEWVRRADTRLKEIRGRLAELNQDNSEEGRSERTKLSYEASRIQSVSEGFVDLIAAREQISGEEFRQAVEGLSVSLEGIDPTGSADATQDSRATEQYESGIPDQEGPTSADLRRLARQGDSDAALELARRHETGDRAEPHEAKARYWFNVALSQAGDTDAMVYLGMVYEGRIQADSPGAPRSINKARDLYRRAFEMGNDEAGRLLGELEQRLAGPAPRARADAATSRSGPSAGVQTPQAPRTPRTPREAPAVQSVPEAAPEAGAPQAAPERPSKPRKPKGFSASKKPPSEVRNEDIYEEMQEDMSRREQARQEQQAQQEAEARAAEQRRLDEELTAEEQRLNEEVAKGAKRDDLRVRIVGRDTDTPLQKKVRAAAKKLGRKVEFIRITQEESRPGQRRRRSPSGIRGFVSRNSDTIYIVAVTENQASRLEQDVLKDHYLQTLLHEVAHGFVQDKTIREQVEQLLTKELADSFRSRFMLGDTAEEIEEELAVYTLTQDIVGSRGVESLIMGSGSFKAFRKVADSLVGLVEAILPKNQRAQLLKRVLKDRVTVTKKAKEVSKDNPARESVDEGRAAKPQPKPQAEPKIAARQETKPTQEDRTSPQPKPIWQMTSAEFLRGFEFVKGMGSTSSPWGVVRDGQSVQGAAVQAKDGTGRKISVRPYFFKTKKAAVESMRELHRQSVEGAIRNGRDVPSNVRAELETKPTPTREATTREPAARPKATPPQESRPNQDGPPVARARLKTEEGFVPDKFRPELQKGFKKQSSIVDVGIPGHRLILYPETSKAERDRITKEFSKPYSRRRGASGIPSASPQVAASLRGIKPASGPAFIKLTKRLANPLRDHVRVQGGKMIVLEGQDSPTNVLGVTATRVGHEFSSQSFGKISDGVYRIEGGKLVDPTAREESIPGSQIFNEVDGTRLSMDIDADALLADIGKVLAIMGSSATTDLSSIALSVNPDRSIGMAALVTNEKGDIVGVSETNIQEGSKAVGAVFGQSLLDTARLHTAAGATKFTLRMNNKVLELSSIGSESTIGRSHLMLMKSDTRSIEDRLRSEGVRFMRERSDSQLVADHAAAFERGDVEAAKRLVDIAAKQAGYTNGPLFHGSKMPTIRIFKPGVEDNGIYFSSSRAVAKTYSGASKKSKIYEGYLRIDNPLEIDAEGGSWGNLANSKVLREGKATGWTVQQLFGFPNSYTDKLSAAVRKSGFDGIVIRNVHDSASARTNIPSDVFIALSPNQIKSADPFTYDDQGQLVPLDKRFDDSTGDIRFMRERFNKASIRRLLDSISALDESGAIRTAMFWEMSNLERAIQRYREELGELADDLNPAELYQLAGGKRIDMVERFDREEIRPFEEKVADLAKRSGMSELEVRDLIQEYAYVVHARDANTELQQRSETERRARAQAKRNGVTEVLEGDELEAMLEQMSKLGISNEEAIERQKQLDAEFDRIGGDWAGAVEMLRSMNRRTLEMRRDAGLITQASYDTLIKRYPSYVPIVRSVFGEEGEVDAGTSRPKKREMRSLRGGNEATGRTFWAASYAITKHDRLVTAHRIAMNEGHMAFWELAMQGALKMQDGTSLADAVFVDQIVQDAVRRARATGSTRTGEDGKPVKASEFDQGVEVGNAISDATADIDSRMMRGKDESPDIVRFKLTRDVDLTDPQVLRDIEDVTSSKDGLTSEERAEGMKPRTQKQREKKLEQLERQKLVYKKGSAMHFRINDPILANAMLNRTPTMMQRAQEKGGLVGKMSNAWMALMNYQRFAYVTASPGFIVGEMFRSPQQVAIMARVLADKYRLPREQAEQLFRNLELEYAKMFFTVPVVGAARSAPFVSSSWKSVKHVLRGGKPRDEYEELIAEAVEAGVLQGGIFNVDSYEQMSAKLRREIADLADGTTKSHRKHGRLSKAGQFAGWVEMVTTALDMSNRMQLYRAAREAGLSKQKAAVMARESTIDFGKKGSFNRGANELYLFFNPRMQGIHQLLRAFKQASRGRLSTTAAVLGRYFLYAFLLKMVVEMFFEDDENPDTWLGKFASMQNTIIPIPGTESENGQYMYFEINNPYGFGAIAKLAYRFGDVLMGDSRPGDLIVGGVGDVMSELTPVQFDGMQLLKGKREGLESFLAAVMPTNVQPLVSAFMNRDWKGAPIAPLGPEFGAGENRESLDYWPDTMRTSIWASQGIAELTGVIMRALQGPQARGVEISPNKLGYIFERYLPGVARQFGDLIKTVGQMSDGTRRGIGSIPVVNLVIGQSGGRSVMPGRFRDDLATIAANLDQDIKADGLAPTLKRYGNLSWLAGPEFSAAKRQLKKLQEARNNATERGDRVRATKLEDRMNEIRKRMLIRAAKMRNR